MSEWTDGYRAALADVGRLGCSRGILTLGGHREAELLQLLADLEGDALVIEREQDNRIRRRRLAAVREAAREAPLFDTWDPP